MGMNKDAVQNERQPRNTATIRPESLMNDRESERLLREGVAATVAAVFKDGSGASHMTDTSSTVGGNIVRSPEDERDGQVTQRLAATVAAVIGNAANTGNFMPTATNSTNNSLHNTNTRPQESEKLLRDVAAVFNSSTMRHHLPLNHCHPMQFLRNQPIDDSALCFCPFHRGFHNAWTVYGLAPDGSVQLNSAARDFSK